MRTKRIHAEPFRTMHILRFIPLYYYCVEVLGILFYSPLSVVKGLTESLNELQCTLWKRKEKLYMQINNTLTFRLKTLFVIRSIFGDLFWIQDTNLDLIKFCTFYVIIHYSLLNSEPKRNSLAGCVSITTCSQTSRHPFRTHAISYHEFYVVIRLPCTSWKLCLKYFSLTFKNRMSNRECKYFVCNCRHAYKSCILDIISQIRKLGAWRE